jgi:hypothetical protein
VAKPKVYLAGKIDGNDDWRDQIVGTQYAISACESPVDIVHPVKRQRELAEFILTGPIYIGCNHACPMSRRINSLAGCCDVGDSNGHPAGNATAYPVRKAAAQLAWASIAASDFVFAWMQDSTAHGTLVEVGYAVGLDKPVYLSSPPCPEPHDHCPQCESWFPGYFPGVVDGRGHDSPGTGFAWALTEWRRRDVAFDSDVERQFWDAHTALGRPIPDLVPQYEITANGKSYRLDFYSPSRRKAIEVDGLAFHNGQESFIKDRNRQRDLEMAGTGVLRFAAKEVMVDAQGCVRQAAQWANSLESQPA